MKSAPRVVLGWVACLAIAGCATKPSGGGHPASRPAQSQAAITIVAFGDSTTAPREGLKMPYAQVLAEELPRRGVAATVFNAGVPGNNTTQAMARLDKDVLSRKPD